jgi:hypothetical protein
MSDSEEDTETGESDVSDDASSDSSTSSDDNIDIQNYRGGDAEFDRVLQIFADDDDGDFDGFLPNYNRDHVFDFRDVQPNEDISINFTARSGPTRVLGGTGNALTYFQNCSPVHLYLLYSVYNVN